MCSYQQLNYVFFFFLEIVHFVFGSMTAETALAKYVAPEKNHNIILCLYFCTLLATLNSVILIHLPIRNQLEMDLFSVFN